MGVLFYYNEAKLKQEIAEYLSIPGVFRVRKYGELDGMF